MHSTLVDSLFVIFSGAALLATLALFARQALPVAYIVLGGLVGPFGLGLVNDPAIVEQMAEIGIIFLLFLLGLDLPPRELLRMFGSTALVTLGTSITFSAIGAGIALLVGHSGSDALLVGATMMFSSTIIGLKLLPTTALHHQHTGEIIISILLLQDLMAIALLLFIKGGKADDGILVLLALPLLVAIALLLERYILIRLIRRFSKIREYIFLMAIGWCLGMAKLAEALGLSLEIGAFIAGVALATSPIALFIADSLKPLRDFFLVLFFVSLGAGFDLALLPTVILPAFILAATLLAVKPWVFAWLLRCTGETPELGLEVGVRLGQVSEFSLLVAMLALEGALLSREAAYLIQTATIFTFMVSTYIVVLRYPTPVALSDRLRRD